MLGTEEGMVNFREILKRFLQILDEKSVDEITELKNFTKSMGSLKKMQPGYLKYTMLFLKKKNRLTFTFFGLIMLTRRILGRNC